MRFSPAPKPYVYVPDCPGTYGEAVPYTTKHGKRVVTGQCKECGKRVAFVTLHALPLKPRGLTRHTPKVAK